MLSLKFINKVVPEEVKLLAKWRKKVQPIWHETFKITLNGTAKWLQGVIDSYDKGLYFVIKDKKKIGHVGFHFIDGEYYVDNVIRGVGKSDGSMTKAVKQIINQNFNRITYVLLFPDNKKAVKFYKKIGFIPYKMSGKYLKMKYEDSS